MKGPKVIINQIANCSFLIFLINNIVTCILWYVFVIYLPANQQKDVEIIVPMKKGPFIFDKR